MFWKLNFRQPSVIDTLLDKEDCTLYEILDEDDVLQECKAQNKKLLDFLTLDENLEELVKMISQDPDSDSEDKVKFKYPHLACELLTCEVHAIVEHLGCNEKLVEMLWAFLDTQDPLNSLLGSFVSKVLSMLLNQKTDVIFEYMRCREGFISSFLHHLGTSAIMDLLLHMVAAPEGDQLRHEVSMWLKDQGVVEKLVDFIHPIADPNQCCNASQALCEIIRIMRETSQISCPSPLLDVLESEEVVQRLLSNMFSSETPSDVAVINGIAVMLTLMEKRCLTSPVATFSRSFIAPPEENRIPDNYPGLEHLLVAVVPKLKDFYSLLSRRPTGPPMLTSIGKLDPPFGNTRLQVVRLMAALLQYNNIRICRELIRLKAFSILMDLFFEYPWNNFLHSQVESCINMAVSGPVLYSKEGSNPGDHEEQQQQASISLRHHLLKECRLVHRLLEGAERNEKILTEPKGCRQGYMGHLIRMVNSLSQCSGAEDEPLEEVLRHSVDEKTFQEWTEFISGPVAEQNKKNDIKLGGSRPAPGSMDDSDDEFEQGNMQMDNELEKAFSQYQDAKYTNPIPEEYGMEDEMVVNIEPFGETFTRLMDIGFDVSADEVQSDAAASFEAMYAARIQQFDDCESDEEESTIWVDKEVSVVSAVDQQSLSSDDEDDSRRREFQTSSSDEEEGGGAASSKKAVVYMTSSSSSSSSSSSASNPLAKITSTATPQHPDRMDVDLAEKLMWHSTYSSSNKEEEEEDEGEGGGVSHQQQADWTREPEPTAGPPPAAVATSSPNGSGGNWADFSVFEKTSQTTTDLDSAPSPSHRDQYIADNEESPQRHDTKQYSKLEESPLRMDNVVVNIPGEGEGEGRGGGGLGREDDPSDDESDEDCRSSSDSDEDRTGSYDINTSSPDKELLLKKSPHQPTRRKGEEEGSETVRTPDDRPLENQTTGETSHDLSTPSGHELSPNGVAAAVVHVGNAVNKLSDGHTGAEEDESELGENLNFLQRGLLSKKSLDDDQRLIEEKRAEAREACSRYEQEVQGLQQAHVETR